MNDEDMEYKREPDAWLVLHGNYAFGPFPSHEAAQMVSDHTLCSCERKVIPTYFPTGIVMSIDLPALQQYFEQRTVPEHLN